MTRVLDFEAILQRLRAFYGPQPLPPSDPFALYVWEVMNFQAAPPRREAALGALRRIPALTPDSIWKTPLPKLEGAAGLAGPYLDERVRALRAGADVFRRQLELGKTIAGRSVFAARRALAALPRLDAAGQARMLLHCGNWPCVPVDATTARVVVRLGLCEPETDGRRQARRVRRALELVVPRDLETRRRAIQLLEHHGQSTCLEFDPHCGVCPLRDECPGRAQ